MNPPPPFPSYYQPSPPFTSLPPPPPPAPHLRPLPDVAAPDLSTALSALTSLLCLTETTLNSLSPLLPAPPSSAVIPCPFNPSHLLPHSSLFSHYLSCPSSPTPICDPHPLRYLHNLHLTPTNSFTQSTQNPPSRELSFSLKNFLNLPRNFFYSNCPGAVISDPSNPNGSSSPMLILPGLLSAECAQFGHNNGLDEMDFPLESITIFPSEIWAVRNEIEGWVDYPSSYSCRLLRSILSLGKSDFSCLMTWIIENSPKYGLVIDLAMRDHIFLLFKLCLKVIVREAIGLSDFSYNKREDRELRLGEKIFDCPDLTKVMVWLGSQLTILYGEVSGNSFAIRMLKQCLLDSALSTACFPLVEKAKESAEPKEVDGNSVGAIEKSGKEERRMMDESALKSTIFVCQVAAAVAALYERSWLEENITELRNAGQLTAYQRFLEHETISNSAHEERQKRSNYRPIIEHDGVLSKRSHNQGPNRFKTREELLAEERDYKRRRMSYRGKKIKRTPSQVMRDIIDEFMDEIKVAGGLGFGKESEGAEATASGSFSIPNIASDVLELTKDQAALDAYRSMNSEDNYGKHYEKHNRDSGSRHESADNSRSGKRERHDRKDDSKSLDRQKSGMHLDEHARNRGKRDDSEVSEETMSQSSGGNIRKLHERKSRRNEGSGHDSELRHKHARKQHKDHRSDSILTEYEDRYDPSNTRDNYEYDS